MKRLRRSSYTEDVPVVGNYVPHKTIVGDGLNYAFNDSIDRIKKQVTGKLFTYIDSLDSDMDTKKARKDMLSGIINDVISQLYEEKSANIHELEAWLQEQFVENKAARMNDSYFPHYKGLELFEEELSESQEKADK
jgi:hypothetical protein